MKPARAQDVHLRDKLAKAYRNQEWLAVVRTGEKLARHGQVPAAALTLMAASFQRLGQAARAEACFRDAITLAPGNAVNFTHLGEMLRKQGRLSEALAVCDAGVEHHPREVELLFVRACVLRDGKKQVEALQGFSAVLAIAPDNVAAINELGVVLAALGQADRATEAFCTVLMLDPTHAAALRNLGQILTLAGRQDEAIGIFRLAIERAPDNLFLRLRKAYQQLHICDWSEFGEFDSRLGEADALCDAGTPFVMLALADDPAVQLHHARAYAGSVAKAAGSAKTPAMPAARNRIRIGYLSADFHDHATMYLMAGLLREHDRSKFEIHAFSHGPDCPDHAMRLFAVERSDSFTDLAGMGDGEAAERIRAAGLDVLVDLKGYTQDSRTGILARRPAPLQVAWLGFPGSMGADFIDYMVADEVVVPAAERGHYDERIIYLPGSYQPNDDRRAIATTVPTRAELGLPEDGFVFCSFNASYKLTPHEFDIWMRLLGQVEGSALWLLAGNDATRANLRVEAERRGISGDRLVYAGKLPQAEHLARIGQADLFVDTFRVNAHTTMSDALWAGLPAVTLAGRQFAARVGASVLEAAGLPELVAHDPGEYEALCLSLARDPARLAGYRQHLTAHRASLSLFDTVAYARKFEAGIAAAVERARHGLTPADLHIA